MATTLPGLIMSIADCLLVMVAFLVPFGMAAVFVEMGLR